MGEKEATRGAPKDHAPKGHEKTDHAETLTVGGREVRVTHPDKPYFSREVKLSKLDVVRYYLAVADGALGGIRDRPLVLKRFVDGAEISADFEGQDDIHILALLVDEKDGALLERLAGKPGEAADARAANGGERLRRICDRSRRDSRRRRRQSGKASSGAGSGRGGHAESMNDAFDRFLKREHPGTFRQRSGPPSTSSTVRSAGGISSLAHAVWYKDSERLIRSLAGAGLDAVEVFHPDHGPEEEARLGHLVREFGLLATAGSDFHGVPEGRKHPGGVVGTAEMLDLMRARRRR